MKTLYGDVANKKVVMDVKLKLFLMNQSGAYPPSPNPDQAQAEIIRSRIKWNARTSQTGTNIVVSSNLETAEETVMTNFAKMTLFDVFVNIKPNKGF